MCMHSLMERKTERETMYEHDTKRRRGTEIQELQFVEVGRILRLASLKMVKGFPSIKQRANSWLEYWTANTPMTKTDLQKTHKKNWGIEFFFK